MQTVCSRRYFQDARKRGGQILLKNTSPVFTFHQEGSTFSRKFYLLSIVWSQILRSIYQTINISCSVGLRLQWGRVAVKSRPVKKMPGVTNLLNSRNWQPKSAPLLINHTLIATYSARESMEYPINLTTYKWRHPSGCMWTSLV